MGFIPLGDSRQIDCFVSDIRYDGSQVFEVGNMLAFLATWLYLFVNAVEFVGHKVFFGVDLHVVSL